MARLTRVVQEQLEDLVDDALEQAEVEPKYTPSLFGVRINRPRGVVVVYEKRLKLPEQQTWRDKDRWERVDGSAHFMRQHSAIDAAVDISQQQGLNFRISSIRFIRASQSCDVRHWANARFIYV